MRQNKLWFTVSGILAVLAMVLILPANTWASGKYSVLHRFKGSNDGRFPVGNLIFDGAGNLYGTAGTVLKLTPNSDGSWTESLIGGGDSSPDNGGIIFDAVGNIYGTTAYGGAYGGGSVFRLKPNQDGSWTQSDLYSFTGGADGRPLAGVILDALGNLYGTTEAGGAGGGTVFKLTLSADGSWTESVLHSFSFPFDADGGNIFAGLILDGAGSLYGTTTNGGAPANVGVVFKLTPKSDGSWTESVLHTFTGGADGAEPQAGLIFDGSGNLYGTTVNGGKLSDCGGFGCGVVFKLTPNSDGSWTESVLHTFTGDLGAEPIAGLTIDAAGKLYGTARISRVGAGAVFKMTLNSDGSWTYKVVHEFLGKPASSPWGGLVFDKTGNAYGTTTGCGDGYNCQGVVFEVTPSLGFVSATRRRGR